MRTTAEAIRAERTRRVEVGGAALLAAATAIGLAWLAGSVSPASAPTPASATSAAGMLADPPTPDPLQREVWIADLTATAAELTRLAPSPTAVPMPTSRPKPAARFCGTETPTHSTCEWAPSPPPTPTPLPICETPIPGSRCQVPPEGIRHDRATAGS